MSRRPFVPAFTGTDSPSLFTIGTVLPQHNGQTAGGPTKYLNSSSRLLDCISLISLQPLGKSLLRFWGLRLSRL